MKAFNLCKYCSNNIEKDIIIQSGTCESDVKCAFCAVKNKYNPFILQRKKDKQFMCRKYIGLSFCEIQGVFGATVLSNKKQQLSP